MPVLTRTRAILLTTLVVAALASVAVLSKDTPSAKPEDVGLSSERLARMDKFIHGYVDAGRTPGVMPVSTFTSAKAGKNFDSGSVSWNLPSSNSMSSATDVIGLVMEYMRKIASFVIASPPAVSRTPKLSK